MCGIAGLLPLAEPAPEALIRARLGSMLDIQAHRGPDDRGTDIREGLGLGHLRLSILDLSNAGHQPMQSPDGRYTLVFNGEIYNYLELRSELAPRKFISSSDTEVLLAAWERWGSACLDRLDGMFAFAILDRVENILWIVRDRFGVKPLYYSRLQLDGRDYLAFSSEIKGLHAAGVYPEAETRGWSSYLANGHTDHTQRTFWKDVTRVMPGELVRVDLGAGTFDVRKWYSLPDRVAQAEPDLRTDAEVQEDLREQLFASVSLRLRSDVPVGIALSGGLDSSMLYEITRRIRGDAAAVHSFTYVTGDARYDETDWVNALIGADPQRHNECKLTPEEVPAMSERMMWAEDEPFGGLPTLAISKCFAAARAQGVLVLMDGQGLDEQWAGYDYYGRAESLIAEKGGVIQGSARVGGEQGVLMPEFATQAEFSADVSEGFDPMTGVQLRDLCTHKIPRVQRFGERASMLHSIELREPFLDHRLVEFSFRQPANRKIRDGVRKWMPRRVAKSLIPSAVYDAPKRPVQTPQREWLRQELFEYARDRIEYALENGAEGWFDRKALMAEIDQYRNAGADNSFHIWQWLSLGQFLQLAKERRSLHSAYD